MPEAPDCLVPIDFLIVGAIVEANSNDGHSRKRSSRNWLCRTRPRLPCAPQCSWVWGTLPHEKEPDKIQFATAKPQIPGLQTTH